MNRRTDARLQHAIVGLVVLALAGVVVWAGLQRPDRDALVPTAVVPPVAAAPAPEPAPVARQSRHDAPQVDPDWAAHTAGAAGIPQTALIAYARATLRAPESCHLGWTTLAGIGWIESQHGTIDGRALAADGRSSEPILGPRLDGAGPVAAIPVPAGGSAWHGDADWDRAVGPMQFISSSWRDWGADGDTDGTTDPHDIDDAAYAAARYLCADGHDLSTGEGWSAAVLSYNHATTYLNAVHHAASTYASRTT